MKIILILLFNSFTIAASMADKIGSGHSFQPRQFSADQSVHFPTKEEQGQEDEQEQRALRKKLLEEQSEEVEKILLEDKLESDFQPQEQVFGPLETLVEKEPDLFEGLYLKDLSVFGTKIFKNLSLQLSRIPLHQRHVPDTYKLGAGDRLRIHAWNESQDQTISVEVNQSGNIQFPLAGEVAVLGIQKQGLNDYLKSKLSKFYKNLKVTSELIGLRQFPVYVTGEVRLPGVYVGTALSTPIKLLMASGGINSNGSLRNVQVIRNGEIAHNIDLYNFLMRGQVAHGIFLQPEDVLHVPIAGRRVAVVGKVRRPAIYEISGDEDFRAAIKLAGGFEADAVQGSVQRLSFDRMGNPRLSDLDYKYSKSKRIEDGELLIVRGSKAVLENKVQILGHVFHPGYYQWAPNLNVKKIIEKARGLKPGAFTIRAEILRPLQEPTIQGLNSSVKTLLSTSVLAVNLANEMNGSSKTLLLRGDVLQIFSIDESQLAPKIEVIGEVETSGEFELRSGERVRDVLFKAKLIRSSHLLRGEVHRPMTTGVAVIDFHVGEAMSADENQNLELQNGDVISIFENPDIKNTGRLTLIGEVMFPGVYPFKRGERLSAIIDRAGGFTDQAYLMASKFFRKSVRKRQIKTRENYLEREKKELEMARLEVSQDAEAKEAKDKLQNLETVSEALDGLENAEIRGRITLDMSEVSGLNSLIGHNSDLRLEDGDTFEIPARPMEVSVVGQVYSPLTALYREGLTFMDYVGLAGGLTEQAMRNKIYVIKADGTAIPVSNRRRARGLAKYVSSVKKNSKIYEYGGLQVGDSIVVPTRVGVREDRFQESLDRIYKMAISVGALGGLFK